MAREEPFKVRGVFSMAAMIPDLDKSPLALVIEDLKRDPPKHRIAGLTLARHWNG